MKFKILYFLFFVFFNLFFLANPVFAHHSYRVKNHYHSKQYSKNHLKEFAPVHMSFDVQTKTGFGFTDRYDVFFDRPISNIKIGNYGIQTSLVAEVPSGWGLKLRGGYERAFHTSKGFARIARNYGDMAFFFTHTWKNLKNKKMITKQNLKENLEEKKLSSKKVQPTVQPFIEIGPQLRFSPSGKQAYLAVGGGATVQVSKKVTVVLELIPSTDFTGVFVDALIGFRFPLRAFAREENK